MAMRIRYCPQLFFAICMLRPYSHDVVALIVNFPCKKVLSSLWAVWNSSIVQDGLFAFIFWNISSISNFGCNFWPSVIVLTVGTKNSAKCLSSSNSSSIRVFYCVCGDVIIWLYHLAFFSSVGGPKLVLVGHWANDDLKKILIFQNEYLYVLSMFCCSLVWFCLSSFQLSRKTCS